MINANNLLQRRPTQITGSFSNPDIIDSLQKINSNLSVAKNLIEKTNENEKKRTELVRKKEETNKRKDEENKKEQVKRQQKLLSFAAPNITKTGFLDSIKNFLLYTIMGYGALRLMKHLPKILDMAKALAPIATKAEEMIGMLFNGISSGIDNGYKAYDKLRALSKSIGGEDYQKTFDDFSGKLNTFVNASILVGLAVAGSGFFAGKGRGPGKLPSGSIRRPMGAAGAPTRPNASGITQGGAGVNRGPLNRGPQVTQGSRGPNLNPLRTAPAVTQGMGDALASKAGRRAFLTTAKNLTSRIKLPVIGGLIDFALLWALGENPGRAAFRAIGSTLLGSVGGALGGAVGVAGGPLALASGALGFLAGGALGDYAGGALYDVFFGGKTPTNKPKKVEARAGGGRIGSKKVSTRTIKKAPKQPKKYQPKQTKPGSSVGGEKEIQRLFAAPKEKDIKSPGRSLSSTARSLKKIPLLGGIMGASVDVAQGQEIDRNAFKNFSNNLGLLIDNLVNDQVAMNTNDIQRSIYAMAGGGAVPASRTLNVGQSVGEKFADAMNRTIEIASRSRVEEVLRDLRKELMLKDPAGSGGGSGVPGDLEGSPGGAYGGYAPTGIQKDIYEYLINEKGMSDVQALGIMANISRESSFIPSQMSGDDGGAGGLFQWKIPRSNAMSRAVPDWKTNWKGQIDYALREPGEPGPQYMSTKFSSPQEAADWWMRKWERPADKIAASQVHERYLSSIPRASNGTAQFRGASFSNGAIPKASYVKGVLDQSGEPGFDVTWRGNNNIAVLPGVVKEIGKKYGARYGNVVVVESIDPVTGKKVDVLYAHFPDGGIAVRRGQQVNMGQVLGRMGNLGEPGIGNITGQHASIDFYEANSYSRYSRWQGLSREIISAAQSGNLPNKWKRSGTSSTTLNPTSSILGLQNSMSTKNFGRISGVGSKGYMIVPGHAAGGGAEGEKGLVKRLARNAYNNIKAKNPNMNVKYTDVDSMFPDTDAGFKKYLAWVKKMEDDGYEILEVHMDAPGGTGRGVIVPISELNPAESRFAGGHGAYSRGFRDLGNPKRGASIFELGNMNEKFGRGEITKEQLDALTKPFENSILGPTSFNTTPSSAKSVASISDPKTRDIEYESNTNIAILPVIVDRPQIVSVPQNRASFTFA